ncbi:MAG: hypothetical protein NT154_10020 [Verrucomicrobia bacterium]|nr:hypothetical protein [Verrucomicrobiota bacterium]
MTEDAYICQLRGGWPQDSDASLEVIALADEAIRAFPRSARLLVMRGNLIELGPESCPHPLDEALRSYRRAVEIDPLFAEAWEEIGHYYDAVLDDEERARPYFDRARGLRDRGEPSASNSGPARQPI